MTLHPKSVFGKRLRLARERTGLAQFELGVLIGLDEGCSNTRISRYETGVHEPPFATAERLAAILKVPAAYLYCRDDQLADLLLELADLTESELLKLRQSTKRLRKMRAKASTSINISTAR